LERVKLARKQSHKALSLFPLLIPKAPPPDYLTLDRALETGAVELTEVDKGGSVPRIRLVNRSGHKVLVVDGEELVGAKQNRIVNATFLIGAHCEVILPVSCVEAQRWSWRSHTFSHGKAAMPVYLRKGAHCHR
jgi:hypothetical protein